MAVEEFGEVTGGQVIESFVGDGEYFEFNPVFHGEPVEFMEDGSDMVSGAGSGE